ncbi:MAG TPA: hypothetical protein VGV68_03160 [Terriglobia bacterium]|nr:hypothetical protein [Terriglobia bacterium]
MANIKSSIGSHLMRLAAALAVLASPSQVFAQMCPACYSNAAAQTPGLLQALRIGILVMMFPSLLMFIVIFVVVFRRRNSFNAESDGEMIFNHDSGNIVAPDLERAAAKV